MQNLSLYHIAEEAKSIFEQKVKTDKATSYTKIWEEALLELAHKYGYLAGYTNSPDGEQLDNKAKGQGGQEWLFDLYWWKWGKTKEVAEMPLVAEIELGETWDHVRVDFWKLIVNKAPMKLMIAHKSGVNLDKMKQMIQGFSKAHSPGTREEYVVILCETQEGPFEVMKL